MTTSIQSFTLIYFRKYKKKEKEKEKVVSSYRYISSVPKIKEKKFKRNIKMLHKMQQEIVDFLAHETIITYKETCFSYPSTILTGDLHKKKNEENYMYWLPK